MVARLFVAVATVLASAFLYPVLAQAPTPSAAEI